jgi:hypothetical protein
MHRMNVALVSLLGITPVAWAAKPIVMVPEPKVRIYVTIADDSNPKHQSSLNWKLGEIRKQLSRDKGWRFQWWLQPVDRREDAEVALELTDYERKTLGHGYMDNIFLMGKITRLPTGHPSPIQARSLEKNDAEVEERLLNAVIDAIDPWVEKSRLKQKVR